MAWPRLQQVFTKLSHEPMACLPCSHAAAATPLATPAAVIFSQLGQEGSALYLLSSLLPDM